jgi:hypothetical protein
MYTPQADEQAQILQTMGLQGKAAPGGATSPNAFIDKLIAQNSAAKGDNISGVPTKDEWEASQNQAKTKAYETAVSKLPKPEDLPYKWSTTAGQAAGAAEQQIKSGYEQAAQTGNELTLGNIAGKTAAGMGMLAGGINWAMSPLAPLFSPLSKAVEAVGGAAAELPSVQKFAMSPAGEATEKAARFAADLSTVMGATAPFEKISGLKVPEKAPGVTPKPTELTVQPATPPAKAPIAGEPNTKVVVQNYTRAVKPSVSGKVGAGQMAKFESDVIDAGKAIIGNKDKLSFTDENGDVQTGRLPQTRQELADATTQTKSNIWTEINDIATRQGKAGVTADTSNIIAELDRISKDEALSMVNPSAQKYALQATELFRNPDGTPKQVNVQVAQDVIKGFNAQLEAFYENPIHSDVSRMAVDAKIVYEFRRALEDAMGKVEGPEYAALKRQYGALSSLERDINRAALVEMKQSQQGGPAASFVNILSGGDILTGLAMLNPSTIKLGAMRLAANKMYNWYYSPERALGSMFTELEKGGASTFKAAPPNK